MTRIKWLNWWRKKTIQSFIQLVNVHTIPLQLETTVHMVINSMSPSKTLLRIKVWIAFLTFLLTLKNCYAGFDDKKLADAFFEYFGPGTIYENARTQTGKPVKGPWTNHCMKIFIAKRENGEKPEADANSKDPDGLCKAVPVIALHSGKDSLSKEVTKCVQTIQVYTYYGVLDYLTE